MSAETEPLIGDVNTKLTFLRRTGRRQFECCVGALIVAFAISVAVIVISFNGIKETDDTQVSVQSGLEALQNRDKLELNMKHLEINSPSYRHQMSTATTKTADKIARAGFATYYASKNYAKYMKANFSRETCMPEVLKTAGLCNLPPRPDCPPSRYREINGTCNNLNHPAEWGVAYRNFRRMLPPNYADGVGEPRGGVEPNSLPSASTVSSLVHRPTYKADLNFTVMLAVWGQFIDHDITATALSRGKDGTTIACCSSKSMHPECFPVWEKHSDGQKSCREFVRSAPAATCCFGPREQINQVSSYLDGSVVYGSDMNLATKLRNLQNGTLKMLTTKSGRHLLPVSEDPEDGCNRSDMIEKNRYCFVSGDARANENLHLTTMHLLWARQHNRIANILLSLNPSWTDEQLYQEAKHIVSAQIQHITYSEFLPIILGPNAIIKYKLQVVKVGYYYNYNASRDATIANCFASAAFRFGHTLIPGLIRIIGKNETKEEYIKLHEMLFDPFRLYDDELNGVIKGAINTPIEAADALFTNELKQHLFERVEKNQTKPCGLDLVALNIQRGRDHGLPPYAEWRRHCQLSVPQNFRDMSQYTDKESLDIISTLYSTVGDIDLYTGALAEIPIKDSLVGPTASCIIADQFLRLRQADRYWYETSERPQAFSPVQLSEIRRTTLASIICENGDAIELLPQWVMLALNGTNNPARICSQISSTNFSSWKKF